MVMSIEDEVKSRTKWISYNGKDICFGDYKNVTASLFPPLIKAIKNKILDAGQKDLL